MREYTHEVYARCMGKYIICMILHSYINARTHGTTNNHVHCNNLHVYRLILMHTDQLAIIYIIIYMSQCRYTRPYIHLDEIMHG